MASWRGSFGRIRGSCVWNAPTPGYLTHEQIPDELDFASIDGQLLSLKLILPAVAGVLKNGGQVASLVKPQFEAREKKK